MVIVRFPVSLMDSFLFSCWTVGTIEGRRLDAVQTLTPMATRLSFLMRILTMHLHGVFNLFAC